MEKMPPSPGTQAAQDALPEAIDPCRLFDSHLGFVWRNLRRLGVAESMIEDAAQDVFLVVHRRWDTWKPERSAVETWLFGIVLRVAQNHRRSQRRRLAWLLPVSDRGELHEAASPADGPAEILAQREAAAILERALAPLDQDKRAIFLMIDVEQMSVPQAAAELGINLNTAYWRLRKARLGFRHALTKLCADRNLPYRRMKP
jgi:RNA polymerase sigma-70 factor, ECF subfamily